MNTTAAPFEFKNISDAGHIEGMAAGFGDVDQGGDKILAGALSKTLADRGGRPLPMLLHHDMRRPAGAWTDWREESDGLHVKGRFSLGTRDGDEGYQLARDGALPCISIGWKSAGPPRFEGGVRVLPAINLFEASLVVAGMHPRTLVHEVKSIGSPRDIEDLLRGEYGVSSRKAKAAASMAWKAINDSTDDDAATAEMAALFSTSAARIAGR